MLCQLLNLVGPSGEKAIDCSTWLGSKKKGRGDVVVCVDVQVLIAANRTKRKTAKCSVPSRGIDNRMRRRQQPCRAQRISRALGFFLVKLRTYHIRYIVWRMCSYAFCLFLQSHVAVGKRKVKTSKKEQATAAAQTNKRSAQRPAQSGVHTAQHTL